MRYGLCFILSLLLQATFAQVDFKQQEDSLVKKMQAMFTKDRTDAQRLQDNETFRRSLEESLKQEGSFAYPFEQLKDISILASDDNRFKIFTWNIPLEDGTHRYFGYTQALNKRTKQYQLHQLQDDSENIKHPEITSTDHRKWYGMIYYQLITYKFRKKYYYTLLGWDGNNKLTTKKIIDVISFNNNGDPRFGSNVFKIEGQKRYPKRIIFEYSSSAVMSLKFDEKKKRIIFDHLSPNDQSLAGQYQYYGPDFSFDAMQFKKGKWIYIPDVDARNEKDPKDELYQDPKKKGDKQQEKDFYAPEQK